MIKRKGGYSGDKAFPIKFHASRELRTALIDLAEERQLAMACIVRGIVEEAIRRDHSIPGRDSSATDGE
jgi:hypothetical protein